jgi:hypothetical protein
VATRQLNDHPESRPLHSALGSAGEALLARVLGRWRTWDELNEELEDQIRAIDDLTAILREQIEAERTETNCRRAA